MEDQNLFHCLSHLVRQRCANGGQNLERIVGKGDAKRELQIRDGYSIKVEILQMKQTKRILEELSQRSWT